MVIPRARHRIRLGGLFAVLLLLSTGFALVAVSPEPSNTNTQLSRQQSTDSPKQKPVFGSANGRVSARGSFQGPMPNESEPERYMPSAFTSRTDSTHANPAITTYPSRSPSTPVSVFSKDGDDSETTQSGRDTQRNRPDDSAFEDDPSRRAQLYRLKRIPVGAKDIPMDRYRVALDHMAKMRRYSSASNKLLRSKEESAQVSAEALATWTSLGPGNIGGRTRALVIDPTNPHTIFAAAVAGGVWKSTNGGASWFPTSDLTANLAVCALAMDPSNHQVLFAGTGEIYASDGLQGNGIFRTTDGGTSWTQLTSTASNTNFHYVNDIIISPSNSQRLYAATNTGIWRSVNGGTNWTRVLNSDPPSEGCTDLAIRADATSPLSCFHRLDRLVSITSQVASALSFHLQSGSA